MNRLLVLILFATPLYVARRLDAAEGRQPNIVYILLDDAGYGDLSCYGQKLFATPNIDRLAAEGMKFTDHYSGSTVCAPTRCCLMTGVHTGHSYVRGNREVQPEGQAAMPASIVTIPRLLHDAGYTTGAFGKWGLGARDRRVIRRSISIHSLATTASDKPTITIRLTFGRISSELNSMARPIVRR